MCFWISASSLLRGIAPTSWPTTRPPLKMRSVGIDVTPVLLRDDLVVVDVHLGDLEAALVLVGEGVDGGRDLLAGAAPDGPEIDEGRDVGLQDFGLEVRVGELFDVLR